MKKYSWRKWVIWSLREANKFGASCAPLCIRTKPIKLLKRFFCGGSCDYRFIISSGDRLYTKLSWENLWTFGVIATKCNIFVLRATLKILNLVIYYQLTHILLIKILQSRYYLSQWNCSLLIFILVIVQSTINISNFKKRITTYINKKRHQ